jgi:hypothetical protein
MACLIFRPYLTRSPFHTPRNLDASRKGIKNKAIMISETLPEEKTDGVVGRVKWWRKRVVERSFSNCRTIENDV